MTHEAIAHRRDDPDSTAPAAHPPRRRGRPAGRTLPAEQETQQRVLAQARRLFMQRGFASVAVGEVARAAGVTKPTLYYHFGDKEGLYAAVLCDVLRTIGGYLRQVTEAPGSVRDRLYQLALGYFRHADATMEPMLRDTTELIGPTRAAQVWQAYEEECLSPLRAFLLDGMRTGEIRYTDAGVLVRAFFALLDGFTASGGHTMRADEEHQRMAALLVQLFLDGVSPREVLSS